MFACIKGFMNEIVRIRLVTLIRENMVSNIDAYLFFNIITLYRQKFSPLSHHFKKFKFYRKILKNLKGF